MEKQEILDILNADHLEIYDQELFTGTPKYYWTLNNVLKTVPGITPITYRNKYTLREAFYVHTPQKAFIKNPDKMKTIFESNIRILDWKKFDAELSQYACWTLMKEIGKDTPTEFHQEYFMHPNNKPIDIYTNAAAMARIRLREVVRKYQHQLSGIIGRLTGNQSALMREIHTLFFGNHSTQDLQSIYKMNENKPLSDYMNARLLHMYGQILKNIVNRWDAIMGIRTYSQLRKIAYDESIAARHNFRGGTPEQNFEITPINKIEQWRNNRETEFAKRFLTQQR